MIHAGSLAEIEQRYSIVYADPPWTFKNYNDATATKSVLGHYQTMTQEDIARLPVQEIAEKDSVLFLWVTMPTLPVGLDVIKRWGFEYKTCAFTWIKTNRKSGGLFWGLGHYTRANSELCVLATKGNPLPRLAHDVHSVVMSPVMEHSRKPHEVRERIVRLFGDLPRIELFARQRIEGWDSWGLDADKQPATLFDHDYAENARSSK